MTWKIIVIPAADHLSMREEDIPETLEGLQAAIGGGYIEHVHVGNHLLVPSREFEGLAMYVDEDGITKRLPHNNRASLLYGALRHGQHIYGDAILTGEVHDPLEGDSVADVPAWATLKYFDNHVMELLLTP